jgi:response regulator RpfG family c-di-GMP phosphodiesterase
VLFPNSDIRMIYAMDNHSNKRIKKTILVCDDEQDVLTTFEVVLQSKYNLILVDSGEKCVERYIEEIDRGNKIDLVLLDYRLYDMLGDSVARKIKEYNETKIVLISAYNVDDKLVKELENNGYIIKYILKPIDSDRLANLVDELVENYL